MKLILLAFLCLMPLTLQARDVQDVNLDILTSKRGSEAKQDAFDRAIEEATFKLTENLLGPERTAKVWSSVRPKLLKNSTKYVVFIKGSTPLEQGGQNKVQVQMRLSPDALEGLLREYGATAQTSVRLLPLILVTDSRGARYAWWVDTADAKMTSTSKDIFKKFYDQIAAQLKGKNVYLLDPAPASFRLSVPAAYRSESLSREDQALLAQYLKADVVISGRVDLINDQSGTKLTSDLQLWQAKSGRSMAETQRSDPVPAPTPKMITQVAQDSGSKLASELVGKLNEAIMSGSLNLNIIKLVVAGTMGPRQHAEFKKQLGTLRDIKFLRERMFESQILTYEAETPVATTELAKAIQKTAFTQFKVDISSVQDNSLVLDVRPLSSSSAQ